MTLEFFCNDKDFHDNAVQYVNMGFTNIWSFLKPVGEHQVMQSAFPRLLRAVCTAQPREWVQYSEKYGCSGEVLYTSWLGETGKLNRR